VQIYTEGVEPNAVSGATCILRLADNIYVSLLRALRFLVIEDHDSQRSALVVLRTLGAASLIAQPTTAEKSQPLLNN
jgi:hypothetical protein